MREIQFRGKMRDGGAWVYGDLLRPGNGKHECSVIRVANPERRFSVFGKTVGQYTGLKDKNGTKIFEGDIVGYNEKTYGVICYGEWNCECCYGVYGWYMDRPDLRNVDGMVVIGNIHDNPELLKKEDT